jgi:hypothetical protein
VPIDILLQLMMHQTNIHDDDEAESTQDDMEVAVQSSDISDDGHEDEYEDGDLQPITFNGLTIEQQVQENSITIANSIVKSSINQLCKYIENYLHRYKISSFVLFILTVTNTKININLFQLPF